MPDNRQKEKMLRQAQKSASNPNQSIQATEAKLKKYTAAYGEEDQSSPAFVVLKYFRSDKQCFSEWNKVELEAFSAFNIKMNQLTWQQIASSGGKLGNKTGMGYTQHDKLDIPRNQLGISEDITFFELRVTNKARVHGFRACGAFFLIRLDKDHDLMP